MTIINTTTGQETALSPETIRRFTGELQGELIRPQNMGYDRARQIWNGMIDRYPALIVRCGSTDDVVNAVHLAREHDLRTAVRGGGHNVSGNAICNGGLVIDLSAMRKVQVDPTNHIAHVQGGATIGDVDRATQEYGLAVPLGVVSETGIAGLTLGGGLGWLRNKYGLSCDNLVSAQVVTADGEVVIASEIEDPDLLWGLRGGGGNFGIVTSFDLQAHPVGPQVYWSAAFYHGDQAHRILPFYRDYSAKAPDEVSTIAFLGVFPEGSEAFPKEIHGQPFVALVGLYAGTVQEGEQIMHPLRQAGIPLIDMSGPTTYLKAQQFFDEDYPAGQRYYWKSLNLLELSDAAIDRAIKHSQKQPSQLSTTDLWPIGGAVRRVPDGNTAFRGRHAAFLINPEANWTDPANDQANIFWAREFVAAMQEFSDGSRYLNFPGFFEEGEETMRTTFQNQYARLARLKARYDPTNFFRLNQNIKPADRA